MSNIVPIANHPAVQGIRGLHLMIEDAYGALERATTLVQAKSVIDQATIIEDMAKVLGASIAAQNRAAALRIEAEARAAEIARSITNAKPGPAPKISPASGPISKPKSVVLEEIGLSKQRVSDFEKVRAIPKEKRDEYFQKCQERGEEVTRAGLVRSITAVSASDDYDGDEWYTPVDIVDRVRDLLGEIDLDPASNPHAQKVVRSKKYFTKDDDALTKEWRGRVFCNPPYSTTLVQRFTDHLLHEIDSKRVTAAVYLVNNCTETGWFQSLASRFPFCLPAKRLAFYNRKGAKQAARQGQAIFYTGSARKRFVNLFAAHGVVVGALP